MSHLESDTGSAFHNPAIGWMTWSRAATNQCLQRPVQKPARSGTLPPWKLRRVLIHVDTHIGDRIRCTTLATMVNLSTSQFCRCFLASTGQSPRAFMTSRRVARAKALIRETTLPLAEIALDCGFADQSHFSRVFARYEGTPPGRWRAICKRQRDALIAVQDRSVKPGHHAAPNRA